MSTPGIHFDANQARPSTTGGALCVGFLSGITIWCVWFVTHLPWVGMNELAAKPIVLGAWIAALLLTLRWIPRSGRLTVGLIAGLISSVLGLLILGSKLVAPPDASGVAGSIKPAAGLIVGGFLGLGAVLGLICGGFSRVFADTPPAGRDTWLARFAWICVAALAPLLFVGGLVTSTNSGMAVPDWPNSYGSNMFLYPLGPWLAPDVFFEHSHRLFGTLVGISVLVLMILTVKWDPRPFVRGLAIGAFLLVVVQGSFGGIRVLMGSAQQSEDAKAGRWIAFAHGVLAQLTMLAVVMLAVHLSKARRGFDASQHTIEPAMAKAARILATALMHATILQLVFGAMYRHTRSSHPLWAHVAFSIVVVICAAAAGFIYTSRQKLAGLVGANLRTIGLGLLIVVGVQFTLGWITFIFGGDAHRADSIPQALLRTSHQANGALLLAFATAAFVWGRTLGRLATPAVAAGR